MKVEWRLGRCATTGRLVIVILLSATIALFSGCWEWEVAGPLIGVGAVGTGVTIAAARGARSPRPSVPAENKSGDSSDPPVVHSANSQSLDHGNSLVTQAGPAFTPSTTLPPTIAAAGDERNSHLDHQDQISTQDLSRSSNAGPPDLPVGSFVTASKSSTAPSTLPHTAIAKSPPGPRVNHGRGSINRILVSSAKPQPSDPENGPVAAALPGTAPPGELPTTIVH